jgi:hypothetical protein
MRLGVLVISQIIRVPQNLAVVDDGPGKGMIPS